MKYVKHIQFIFHSSLTYIPGYMLIKFYPTAWSCGFIKAKTVAMIKKTCGK